ncbi:MAG: hypothetical protein IT168_25815 [Bryobacterales bacterium]|nr:hypothetical protein [Bryobacterales bacterium]
MLIGASRNFTRWQCVYSVVGRLAVVLLVIVLVSPMPGGLIPGPNLAQQIEEADFVVVGGVRSGTVSTSGTRSVSNVVLHVDRVLKGDMTPGVEIGATLEGKPAFVAPAMVTPAQKLYGIWFLKKDGGAYSIVPRASGFGELNLAVVAVPEAAPRGRLGLFAAASVANELGAALPWLAGSPVEQAALADQLLDGRNA